MTYEEVQKSLQTATVDIGRCILDQRIETSNRLHYRQLFLGNKRHGLIWGSAMQLSAMGSACGNA